MIRPQVPYLLETYHGDSQDQAPVHHVRTWTAGRQPLFEDKRAVQDLVTCLHRFDARGEAEILAFAIMPDHVHWLLRSRDGRPPERMIQLLKACTTRALNTRLGRCGRRVWEPVHFDRRLSQPADIALTARYIAAGPARCTHKGPVHAASVCLPWDMLSHKGLSS